MRIGGYHTDIPAHDLHAAERTAERAIWGEDKTFWPDSHRQFSIRYPFKRQNHLVTDVQPVSLSSSLKQIDGWGSQKPRYK